jgi:hypothetical protein
MLVGSSGESHTANGQTIDHRVAPTCFALALPWLCPGFALALPCHRRPVETGDLLLRGRLVHPRVHPTPPLSSCDLLEI